MAQWRKTFDSLGGPTYIADPRVDEQARLGELLLARQRVQGEQQDRLFGRRQQADSLGESKRQFDAELAQRQLEARQKLELQSGEAARAQANADRAFGLDERQAGLAVTREQRMERQAIEQAALERARDEAAGKRFDTSQAGEQARFEATQSLAKQQARDQQSRYEDEVKARNLALARSQVEKIQAITANTMEAAERRRERNEDQALALQRETRIADNAKADREQEREKTEGTQQERRKWAIQAREQRFTAALERLAPKKGGRLGHEAQAEAVRAAYREATSPDVDPQRRTYEAAALGDDGEAEVNARLATIADEFFPEQTYMHEEQGWDPVAILGDLAVNNLLPDALRERLLGALDPAKSYKVSGGRQEADKLFGRRR